jgi:hypothetical protein
VGLGCFWTEWTGFAKRKKMVKNKNKRKEKKYKYKKSCPICPIYT